MNNKKSIYNERIVCGTEPYRPSNGSEGEMFIAEWCANCERDRDPDSNPCRILGRTLAYDIDDPLYPKEWVEDDDGPRCTAFTPLGLSL